MVGDELNRIQFIPDQPDADTILYSMGGLRVAYLGTSPDVHAVNTPVYKAQILPADAEFPSNGLPVFHLTWRNDDGGPGYGADSKLDFVAPAEGDYFLHLKDVRAMEGPDFAYRLTIRDEAPDFRLRAEPANPNIPRGGSIPVTVSLDAIRGFDGPIEIAVKGLPKGISASEAVIPPGQMSTMVVLSAASDAAIRHAVCTDQVRWPRRGQRPRFDQNANGDMPSTISPCNSRRFLRRPMWSSQPKPATSLSSRGRRSPSRFTLSATMASKDAFRARSRTFLPVCGW